MEVAAAAAVVVVAVVRLPEGLGIGWRTPISGMQEELRPAFVELLAENVHPQDIDERVPGPTVTHGVSLGLGAAERPAPETLEMLNAVARAHDSVLVSEHIALVRAGENSESPHHEVLEAGHLLPVPLTRLQLDVMVENVEIATEALERPLALEPIARLVEWPGAEMTEGQFVTELLERTGTYLVLDFANVWANAVNHGRDPLEDALAFPLDRIAYCHIAGGEWQEGMYIDTHARDVVRGVSDLARAVMDKTGPLPLMLERDSNFPVREVYFAELDALADGLSLPRITPRAAGNGHSNG